MEKHTLRIALAQINCTVGDLNGNVAKITESLRKAEEYAVDIVAFPELTITGYPPEDLLLKPKFIKDNLNALESIARSVKDIVAIVGFVDKNAGHLHNAAAVIYKGKIRGIYRKMFLPNYSVFDERRYFKPGEGPSVFAFAKCAFGVTICEDIWHKDGPIKSDARAGAKLIFNINASPYYCDKTKEREKIVAAQAKENKVFIAYTNLIGGQDELVFDGQSLLVDNKGRLIKRADAFKEDLLIHDIEIVESGIRSSKKIVKIAGEISNKNKISLVEKSAASLDPVGEVYEALVLGLKDYVSKNGFKKVVLGLSGGIDSALVAVLAVDALGKDNVNVVFMPSRYSSDDSLVDAEKLAQNLGIKFKNISIEDIYKTFLSVLAPYFEGLKPDIAEENLQARIRGTLLMALSNKFGWLVLTTGNKSEMSTGYATLYGDMAGGFAVIKDVPKILVYKLCEYRNSAGRIIPERILTKAPTAELRPNQKDSDSLPVYENLDKILKAYIEEDKELSEIISLGFDKETASRVLNMVDKSEYKRRQSPPGIKITPRAFGKDRRMPITNKYRG